jgi:outer membrane protein OmpA-like peptidoglycan-associated protein
VATNLIAQLTNDLRGDTLRGLASTLGETPARTETALGAAVPAIVAALASKGSTAAGASELLDVIRRTKLDGRQYSDTTNALTAANGVSGLMNAGKSALDAVLGGRTASVTDWLTSYAGINRSSAASLLTIALPLVIGRITQFMGQSGLTAGSLQNVLADQRAFLQDVPEGLRATLGVGDAGGADVVGTYDRVRAAPPVEARAVATAPARAVGTYQVEPRGGGWWKWALPLLLLALIPLLLLWRRPAPRDVAVQTPAVRPEVATSGTPAPTRAVLGDLVERRLPLGVTLRIPSLGVENKLITFIEDANQTPDRELWFSFDRLEFETDSALLKPSSQEQLRNVAEILRAYPNVNVKIGGYTDNVGDDAYNLKLSADRANNTANEIVNLGVDRSRLESEGYGENHPIADNATAEGRQRNRRIDIRVTKK